MGHGCLAIEVVEVTSAICYENKISALTSGVQLRGSLDFDLDSFRPWIILLRLLVLQYYPYVFVANMHYFVLRSRAFLACNRNLLSFVNVVVAKIVTEFIDRE